MLSRGRQRARPAYSGAPESGNRPMTRWAMGGRRMRHYFKFQRPRSPAKCHALRLISALLANSLRARLRDRHVVGPRRFFGQTDVPLAYAGIFTTTLFEIKVNVVL